MNKFLKLTGVSMLAIMTANAANAAGYTCEELVEYTSCNPGHYLSPICSDGYTPVLGLCAYYEMNGDFVVGQTADSCGEYDMYEYKGDGCIKETITYEDIDGYLSEVKTIDFVKATSDTISCTPCPAGTSCAGDTSQLSKCPSGTYQPSTGQSSCIPAPAGNFVADNSSSMFGATAYTACAAGTYQSSTGKSSCSLCPAGSYCATTGLSAATGECAIGTYSLSGATACLSCPATGLTDKDGNTVVATTAATGSTGVTACLVMSDTTFTDDKGVYRFTSNCTFDSKLNYYQGEHAEDGGYIRCKSGFVKAYRESLSDSDFYCVEIPEWACSNAMAYNSEWGANVTWNASTNTCNCGYLDAVPYWHLDLNTGTVRCEGY